MMDTVWNVRVQERAAALLDDGSEKPWPAPPLRPLAELDPSDRPRERLLARGASVLTDVELLSLLVGSGTREKDALTIASEVAAKISQHPASSLRPADIEHVPGLGLTRACRIVAALELGRRLATRPEEDLPTISTPADVFRLTRDIRRLRREHFMVFYLDARHRVERSEIVSIGTLNASLVHPREVFGPAVREPAASIVLAHNHPSGDTTPSEDDVAITRRLVSAGEILGIAVVDHVVVSAKGYTSFREKRLM
jgi:DNA repair protein RadC